MAALQVGGTWWGHFPLTFSMDEKEKLDDFLFPGGEIQSVAGTELSKNASNTGLYIICNAIKPQCPGGLSSPQKTHTNSTQKTTPNHQPAAKLYFLFHCPVWSQPQHIEATLALQPHLWFAHIYNYLELLLHSFQHSLSQTS